MKDLPEERDQEEKHVAVSHSSSKDVSDSHQRQVTKQGQVRKELIDAPFMDSSCCSEKISDPHENQLLSRRAGKRADKCLYI